MEVEQIASFLSGFLRLVFTLTFKLASRLSKAQGKPAHEGQLRGGVSGSGLTGAGKENC